MGADLAIQSGQFNPRRGYGRLASSSSVNEKGVTSGCALFDYISLQSGMK